MTPTPRLAFITIVRTLALSRARYPRLGRALLLGHTLKSLDHSCIVLLAVSGIGTGPELAVRR